MTLQQIPTEWKKIKLSDPEYAQIIMGQSPPSSSYNKNGEGIPFIQGNAEFGFKYAEPNQYTTDPKKTAEKEDILISVRAPVGDVNFSPEKICIGRGIAAIRPNKKNLNKFFLYYSLIHYVNRFHALSTGSTFKAISKRNFNDFLLSVPPLVEQRGIVEVLGTVDECIRLTDAVIERAEELKRGLMQKLLTRGIGHTEYKETPLGIKPKNWLILPIVNICKIIDYRGRTPPYSDSGIPHIRSNNIRDGNIILEDLKYVSEDTYEKYMTRGLPKKGDILFTTEGPLGEVAEITLDIKLSLAQRLVCIRSKKEILLNKFMMYVLQDCNVQKECFMRATGTTLKGIASKNFKKVPIFIPPLEEQNKIIEILENHDKKLLFEKEKRKHLNLIKQGLIQLLLSGKIRVELKGDGLHRIRDGREANN